MRHEKNEKKKLCLDPLNCSFVSKEDLSAVWSAPQVKWPIWELAFGIQTILRQQKWFADMLNLHHMLTAHACSGVGHTLEKSVNSPGVSQGVSYPIIFFALSSSGP
jgi:hypothetical protein